MVNDMMLLYGKSTQVSPRHVVAGCSQSWSEHTKLSGAGLVSAHKSPVVYKPKQIKKEKKKGKKREKKKKERKREKEERKKRERKKKVKKKGT